MSAVFLGSRRFFGQGLRLGALSRRTARHGLLIFDAGEGALGVCPIGDLDNLDAGRRLISKHFRREIGVNLELRHEIAAHEAPFGEEVGAQGEESLLIYPEQCAGVPAELLFPFGTGSLADAPSFGT
jgi:hypothetical protein